MKIVRVSNMNFDLKSQIFFHSFNSRPIKQAKKGRHIKTTNIDCGKFAVMRNNEQTSEGIK